MNLLGMIVIHGGGGNPANLPPAVGYVFLAIFVFLTILSLAVAWSSRNDPRPILKRTKNPYRRYKRVGWRK
jgi:hypothetical protein